MTTGKNFGAYSVAIRTLGTAGEKYVKLMQSIQKQKIQPEQVVVVLPEGYQAPERILGNEKFVFCQKGMIKQRLKALDYITTEYTLFCDDDVEFDEDFVGKLIEPLESQGYACDSGPLLSFFPPNRKKYWVASLLGGACVMVWGRKRRYTHSLRTGGWSYNHSIHTDRHKIYDADYLAWTCFLIRTEVLRNIRFEDELWLERNGYAAFDDQTMFCKLLRNNYRTCVVSDALYIHNDAKTSTKELKSGTFYSYCFNRRVFWQRYILEFANSPIERVWCRICFSYYEMMEKWYDRILLKKGRISKEALKDKKRAKSDANKFVKSDAYKGLSPVVRNRVVG